MGVKIGGNSGNIKLTKPTTKGDDGGYYIPEVNEEGFLSWTPSEEYMPQVEVVNIKGEKGDGGIYVSDEAPESDDVLVWLRPDEEVEEVATKDYVDAAIANIEIPEVDFTGYATEEFVTDAIGNIDFPEVDVSWNDLDDKPFYENVEFIYEYEKTGLKPYMAVSSTGAFYTSYSANGELGTLFQYLSNYESVSIYSDGAGPYICKKQILTGDGYSYFRYGNSSFYSTSREDTGEPFFIQIETNRDTPMYNFYFKDKNSHNLRFVFENRDLKTLDSKFIGADIARKTEIPEEVDLTGYATEEYVDTAIGNIEIPEVTQVKTHYHLDGGLPRETITDNDKIVIQEIYDRLATGDKDFTIVYGGDYCKGVEYTENQIKINAGSNAQFANVAHKFNFVDGLLTDTAYTSFSNTVRTITNASIGSTASLTGKDGATLAKELAYIDENFARKSELPDVSQYATAEEVETAITNALSAIGVAEEGVY